MCVPALQANHAPVSRHPAGPQPAALMERHIAALHRIAGRQLALEFYDQEGRAQAWPAQYALLQRQLPYLSLVGSCQHTKSPLYY